MSAGIRVDLYDPGDKGMGHPSWLLPVQGGVCTRPDGLCIEVVPTFARTEKRSYKDLERLADRVEKHGGFTRKGGASDEAETFQVGDEFITGEDRVEFVLILKRRADERAKGTEEAERLGYERAKRELADKVRAALA